MRYNGKPCASDHSPTKKMKIKIDPVEEAHKAWIRRIKFRAFRKQQLIKRCSQQALAAKALLIEFGKGKNGKSMNQALTELHFGIR